MTIKQSVKNTMDRVGIDYQTLEGQTDQVEVFNRFGGDSAITSPLIAECIEWVYATSNRYEAGDQSVKIADFDRIRYFVAEADPKAYMACLD